jgi:hypothetical protein
METASREEIELFLRGQYRLWNEGKFEDMLALFRKIAPAKLTIEYVGLPPQDGWQALDEMCEAYGGKTQAEVQELLINGNEAAVHVLNFRDKSTGIAPSPSIEFYRFDKGNLEIRYFYRANHPV